MTDRARKIRNKEVECKVNEFHDRLFVHTINVNENNQHSFFRDFKLSPTILPQQKL